MTTLYVRVASLLLFALPASPVLAQDDRKDLSVSVFTGFSIDSFAAKDLHDYLNPDASGDVQEQLVAGFNFQYRLTGTTDNRPKLWLYGESVHGVRSGDVDCAVDANSEICQNLDFQTPATGSGLPSLAIFRKSTSFEGLTGPALRVRPVRFGRESQPAIHQGAARIPHCRRSRWRRARYSSRRARPRAHQGRPQAQLFRNRPWRQ